MCPPPPSGLGALGGSGKLWEALGSSGDARSLKKILFDVGAGSIGKYDNCSFSVDGTGSFKGNEKSNPTVGQKLKYVEQDEVCISITYLSHFEEIVLSSLREVHPYEEIAYEIITLENINENIGMGMFGVLDRSVSEKELFDLIKKNNFPSNSTILAVHTGGLQGIEGMNQSLQSKEWKID